MDMLNDDSVVVRLQALETLHHMAMHDHLKVAEPHLHMVISCSLLQYIKELSSILKCNVSIGSS